jgi:hypothetical protein
MLLLGRWSKVRRFSRLLYLGSKNTLPPSVSTLAETKAGVAHPKVTVCFKRLLSGEVDNLLYSRVCLGLIWAGAVAGRPYPPHREQERKSRLCFQANVDVI